MNETIKSIMTRFSCRDFAPDPLTAEQAGALVDAALAAPSAVNRQPWHVTLITDKAFIDGMDAAGMEVLASAEDKSVYQHVLSRGGKLFYNAPCMVMIAADDTEYALMDCGILSENVSLAAHAMGLGSVICGMARLALQSPRAEEFKKRMGFPDGFRFGIAVLVGTANSVKPPHEPDAGKVTYVGG
ncbi:MAG: nitroreductase family protein [Oscillospiraceae bacterium]|jgi:nitroreductase|nr:nitroreductase family protein [Oscillospiraceae bacterium]